MRRLRYFVLFAVLAMVSVFMVSTRRQSSFATVVEEQKKLDVDQVETITYYSRGYWDEGRGYHAKGCTTIYSDGRVTAEVLYTPSGSIEPVDGIPDDTLVEYWYSQEEFITLVEAFNQNCFLDLPDDLSDYGVCDGGEYIIEINTGTDTYCKGGANPGDERFLNCMDMPSQLMLNRVVAEIVSTYKHQTESVSFFIRTENGLHQLHVDFGSGEPMVLDCFDLSFNSAIGGISMICGNETDYVYVDWKDDLSYAQIYSKIESVPEGQYFWQKDGND